MAFFQKSVLEKYLRNQDESKVIASYSVFKDYFQNLAIQQNIRQAKEEQFQEGFLRELFVKILGYTLNPAPNYNLTTEQKNEKGGKKADGAILKNGSPLAVIELKGTDTKDLDKVNDQAFGYKNNHKECVYVITSNFEKVRFFITNAVEQIEFNLFTLTEYEFRVLWLCLAAENLLEGIPQKVKEESLVAEEDVTKQLYKDYSKFKTDLWQNMVKNRPDLDQLVLFKKSQKLIDRFLFIFFAEDSGLLPPNSISRIVERWNTLKEEDYYKPLIDIIRQYFGYINTGRDGKTPQDNIFAYNGGLFQEDEILDSIRIDDNVLHPHVMKLTGYDFQSEVDVNILGHIFENSLNDIENITAELEGKEVDKSKTKRKKEGVYYTPKYITKYIVDNTVGKLCEEKKVELEIDDEEFTKGRTNRKKETILKLQEKLDKYREWLLGITICDPACGSGAFLNQALDFLIREHKFIDELQAQLYADSIVFQDVSTHILEKNLYGVDINEESVEIAKLSLWLRTAQKGRKLTSLNNNIKCGNSLIDDPEVAGDKAFKWEDEFTNVFKNGGFDVVIGNPPYVSFQHVNNIQKEHYGKIYISASGKYDLYVIFLEFGLNILKNKGKLSLIMPNKFFVSKYGLTIKNIILKHKIDELIDFKDRQIFDGATTYPCILSVSKENPVSNVFNYIDVSSNEFEISGKITVCRQDQLSPNSWHFSDNLDSNILNRILENPPLKSISTNITQGLRTGKLDVYFSKVTTENIRANNLESELLFKCFTGKNIKRYVKLIEEDDILLYPYKKGKPVNIDYYPNVRNYLAQYDYELRERKDSGKIFKNVEKEWFEYWDAKPIVFDSPKIVFPDISKENNFYLDEEGIPYLNSCYAIYLKDDSNYKDVITILNSKLFFFYITRTAPSISGSYYRYKTGYIEKFGIKLFNDSSVVPYSKIVLATREMYSVVQRFLDVVKSKEGVAKLSKRLVKWYELENNSFIEELEKYRMIIFKANNSAFRKLTINEIAEWTQYFKEQKLLYQQVRERVTIINQEIDKLIYDLYGLTEEEIEIVENSIK